MLPKRLCLLAALATAVTVVKGAHAGPQATFPLEEVRPGQTGYGLTTFRGTKPERFEFEVIGVTKNFLPKMDIILVRSDDPKLAVSGFWQGMSGSPLFIQGKLACAFSYGFRFNKVAIGGCTPIDYMKREGFRAARRLQSGSPGPEHKTAGGAARPFGAPAALAERRTEIAALVQWLGGEPHTGVTSAYLGEARTPWLMRAPLPPRAATPVGHGSSAGMVPAAVPLAMSGFSAPAFARARELLADFPLEPMQAGGTGDPQGGPSQFTLGGSLAVQLIRGDMSAAATGTVSYLDGNRVLAFGHPLFHAGELYAPVATANVHTVIPSAMSAFVVASPMREIGALVQDRQSTIMADTNLKTRMIPLDLDIRMHGPQGEERGSFRVEILDNRFMTSILAGISAMSAISYYLPDRDHTTVLMDSTVHLRGHEPLHFVDHLYAPDGVSSVIGGARGLRVLVPLLMNPFAPVQVERIQLRADIRFDASYGEIKELRLPVAELPPGRRSHVDVVLQRFDGQDVIERVPFDVPAHLAGAIVQLEVTAGDSAALDAAPPQSLRDLLAAFRKLLPGNVYAVTLSTAYEGVALRGKLVRDLPPSALDRLHTLAGTGSAASYKTISRSVFPARRVLNGRQTLLVQVADRRR